jgi:hypothetical protein
MRVSAIIDRNGELEHPGAGVGLAICKKFVQAWISRAGMEAEQDHAALCPPVRGDRSTAIFPR